MQKPFPPSSKVNKGLRESWAFFSLVIFFLVCITLGSFYWARNHIIYSLDFKLTLPLTRGAVSWGTNHRPQKSAQARAMWNSQTLGNKGEAHPLLSRFTQSPKDWKGSDLEITHKTLSVHLSHRECQCQRYPVKSEICVWFYYRLLHVFKLVIKDESKKIILVCFATNNIFNNFTTQMLKFSNNVKCFWQINK